MKKYAPTKKWWAALISGLSAVAVSAIDSGWDSTEEKLLGVLLVTQIAAYIKSNDLTPGGVPTA